MRARWQAPALVSLQSGLEAAANKVQDFPESPGESCFDEDGTGVGCPGEEEVGPS
jgi:hypothetical protein